MALTYFFRDLGTLELAARHLLETVAGRSRVRVWDAGCATGMEPYTLAILLAERMSPSAFGNLELHATDYDAPLLEVARAATYEADELDRIPRDLVTRYLEPTPGHGRRYRFNETIRGALHIRHHDLLSLRPIRTGFSLVVCKNVLLHFHYEERIKVIHMFHEALEPGGLLAMEHTQKLPAELAPFYRQVGEVDQVYRRVEVASESHRVHCCVG